MEIAKLFASVGIDDSEFQRKARQDEERFKEIGREAERAGTKVSGFGDRLQKLDGSKLQGFGQAMTAGVTLPLVAMGGAAIKAASDTDESLSKVRVVFGQSAGGIERWSQSAAAAFGQSRQEALESAGSFGALFTAMQIGQPKAAEMSQSLVQLAGDLASFNNSSASEAMTALKAGLVGESEPLRRFGVQLSAAKVEAEALRLGLARNKDELTDSAKAQAAYSLILAQTGSAQGDYARTSDGLANTLRTAKAELSDTAAELGNELVPAAKDALKVGRDLLHTFNDLPAPVKKAAVEFAAFAAVIGPLAMGASATINAVKGVAGIAGLFGGGTAAAGAAGAAGAETAAGGGGGLAMLSNPITGAIAAALALRAGGEGAKAAGFLPKDMPLSALDALGLIDKKAGFGIGDWIKGKLGFGKSAEKASPIVAAKPRKEQPGAGGGSPIGAEDAVKIASAQFSAQMAGAQSALAAVPEDNRAGAEAQRLIPLITARRDSLAKRAAELKPLIEKSASAAQEYWQLEREQAQLTEQATNLKGAAAKEAEENQRRADQNQQQYVENVRRFQANAYREQVTAIEAQVTQAAEGQRANARAAALYPVLEERQRAIAAEVRALQPTAQQSWESANRIQELRNEWADLERQQAQMGRSAAEEAANNAKKAEAENKKTYEAWGRFRQDTAKRFEDEARDAASAFQKSNSDRLSLAGGRVSLAEAQLRNLPGNERQKAAALQPLLLQQLRELSRPVQGESEIDRLNRLTSAEGIKGRLLEGVDPRRRMMALQQLQGFQQEAAQNPFASRALAEAQRHAEEAKRLAPAPVVAQLVIQGELTPQKLWAAFQQMREREYFETGGR